MNAIDLILIIVIALAAGLAIRRIVKTRKSGGCSCGCSGSCEGCKSTCQK